LVENLFLLAIVAIGIGGMGLFWAAMEMPTIEGPWQTITALMTWALVIGVLVLGAQLEGIKVLLAKRK
jgi:hypothetical protein